MLSAEQLTLTSYVPLLCFSTNIPTSVGDRVFISWLLFEILTWVGFTALVKTLDTNWRFSFTDKRGKKSSDAIGLEYAVQARKIYQVGRMGLLALNLAHQWCVDLDLWCLSLLILLHFSVVVITAFFILLIEELEFFLPLFLDWIRD